MTWTVVAYKPASDDYCRGQCMASYPSDFELEEFYERDAVVEFVAEIMFRNTQLEGYEAGYDIHVLPTKEREVLLDGNDNFWVDSEDTVLAGLITDDAKEVAEAKLEYHNLAQDVKRKAKWAAERDERERQERAILAKLQEKYPD